MDLPGRSRSRTRASTSSGASACCNTSTIHKRPSMTSPECSARVAVPCCWTQTRAPGSFRHSILMSPRHLSERR
jgi:hypothetical protein